jgi:hypothetical protein
MILIQTTRTHNTKAIVSSDRERKGEGGKEGKE